MSRKRGTSTTLSYEIESCVSRVCQEKTLVALCSHSGFWAGGFFERRNGTGIRRVSLGGQHGGQG